MADIMAWGEYRPDVNDLDGTHTRSILNVVPRGDGYGPIHDLIAFTTALGAQCRGMFYARNEDGTVSIFGATSDRIYLLDNTTFTWTDVSKDGAAYTTLPATAHWQFAQFGEMVIAVQPNVDPQVFDLGSPTDPFDDLTGSPPKAAYISIVNRFVVLSGLTENPTRVQWSGIDDITNWTAGTGSSDFQDLPDGGAARNVVGGEFGVILQDFAVRRMVFTGGELIFQIDRIGKDVGVLAPYSVCTSGNQIFFLSPQGFEQMDANGNMQPIGREKVDRTFFAEWDDGNIQLVMGATDPRAHKVVFVYKLLTSSGTTWDRALIYDWLLKRWSPAMLEGEFLSSLSRPGLTLEGLDALAPGAMNVTGLADNGSGLIRVTVASTATLTDAAYYTLSGVGGAYADDANGTWEIDKINGTTFDLLGSAVDSSNVSNAVNNGSGLVRLTVASSAAWSTGSKIVVAGIVGTTEANGNWVATVVNGTTIDLQGTTFANAYVSGGTVKDRYDSATDGGLIGGSADAMEFPWDDISTGTLPQLSAFDSDHKLGFFSGDTLEATLETPEQSNGNGRIRVQGFWPITDAATVYGRVSKRENLNASLTYTNETTMSDIGFCAMIRDTRYSRAKIRIPAAETWTYATGVRPEATTGGQR